MNTRNVIRAIAACVLLGLVGNTFAHGLLKEPAARNWFCGAITKPDQVANGVAQYPVCGDAFTAPGIDMTAGYSFMSVLTHTTGRDGIGPRANVCGFNSETWNGAPTVWDQPINWPTNNMVPGSQLFTWDINWGPHFSDTQEFKYWITKPDFVFQVGRPLSFSDFEDLPFCSLAYNDAQPNGNPNVIPNPAAATFQTRCNVPQRSGRHVIYAEWGRNFFTFERFHGCVDAVFQGGTGPTIDARIVITPNVSEFTGTGTISLATLNLSDPPASEAITVLLVVSSGGVADSATRMLIHRPTVATQWFDLGPVTVDPRTVVVGDRVSIRTVTTSGQDAFWPTSPVVITAASTAAAAWPFALAQAVNAANGAVRIGVLNAQGQVVPTQSATANRVYALTTANIASAFLQIAVGAVPPAPTGVAALAGNAQAVVSWNAVSGATGYNVKRSLTSGGPYANVAAAVTGTSFTNTGLVNGTPYYYVITALNASGESPISVQANATPQAASDDGVTVTPMVTSSSPWFNEQQVRLSNTAAISALSITVVVQRTTGVSHSGQYNTVGGSVQQSNSSTTSAITYQFTLGSLSPGANRSFAVQTNGSGTAHPTSGDTYTVTYTVGGVARTRSGTF